MKNVQVTIDEETLAEIDRIGEPLGLKRSEIVRRALRDWLRRQSITRFEEEWIAALRKRPERGNDAADWLDVQAWSKK
jgi:metal-responsive CopG/Arc/MetJ family transcriptional regulator